MKLLFKKDSEGNNYSPYECSGEAVYIPESSYNGYILQLEELAEDVGFDVEEWEEKKKTHLAVILIPIN